jgi:hypothetical protein
VLWVESDVWLGGVDALEVFVEVFVDGSRAPGHMHEKERSPMIAGRCLKVDYQVLTCSSELWKNREQGVRGLSPMSDGRGRQRSE